MRNLHSSWHLGAFGQPVTELAASWVLVSIFTGLYLWWPRSKRALAQAFRMRRPGWSRWRSVHSLLGVVISVFLALLVVTGLTWTNYAGTWLDALRAQLGSGAPSVSTEVAGGEAASQSGGSAGESADVDLTGDIDGVAAAAHEAGLSGALELTPPGEPGHAWTAEVNKRQWPIEDTTVAIDPATGQVTDRVEWSDYPLLAKATTVGIAFHQAELFGVVNQVGLTLLALALVVLILAGYRMWWLRRPAGGLGAPPAAGPLLRNVPLPLLVGFAVLMVLLPTLGVSFLLFLLAERLWRAVRAARPPSSGQR
ncbi:PepSY-associated TM helix domain-containing protein [Salinactinospora qingdaonensis]|uniref:PepSY-associated TM region n=1 Tax=Salinactinospora qingdaonensis TaxID=702744 RepID=A0ABP7F736_9ACTN